MKRASLVLLLALPSAAQDADETIVLQGVTAITLAGDDIADAVIVVRGGKLESIAAGTKPPEGARVVRLPKGCVVTPGFIDAHSHLGSQYEVEEDTESVTPEMRAVEAFSSEHPEAAEAAGSGVTVVALAPGNGNLVGGRIGLIRPDGRRLDQMILEDSTALKLSISPEALRFDRAPTSRPGALDLLRGLLRSRDGNDVATLLLDKKLPAFIHASSASDIERALELADAFQLRAVIVHADEAARALPRLKESKRPVAFGPLTVNDTREKLETPAAMAAAGIPFAFVSDAPATSEADLRTAAILAVRHGLDPREALRALTVHPARMLGIEDRFGTLVPGREADLVVWSGSPLAPSSSVRMVISGGRIVRSVPK